MNISFENIVVIVTGGASGIGKSICDNFHQRGATVIVLDNDKSKVEIINNYNDDKFKAHLVNLTNIKKLKLKVNEIYNRYKDIHILVNNVGLNLIEKFENVDENNFNSVINVNLKSTFFCTQACVPSRF